MINRKNMLKQNQKMLIDAFTSQNSEAYDEALEKLQQVGNNLIEMIELMDKNSDFYLRIMPIIKQERELVTQKDYQEFISKNQKTLSKNFQKNAYLAFLMQQIEEKAQPPPKTRHLHNSPQQPNTKPKKNKSKTIEIESQDENFNSQSVSPLKHKYQKRQNLQNQLDEQFQIVEIGSRDKMSEQDELIMEKMVEQNLPYSKIVHKFSESYSSREIKKKFTKYSKRKNL